MENTQISQNNLNTSRERNSLSSKSSSTLIEKLRPSSKNRLISKKYKLFSDNPKNKSNPNQLTTGITDNEIPQAQINKINTHSNNPNSHNQYIPTSSDISHTDLRDWGIDPIHFENQNLGSSSIFNEQWNNIVKQRKQEQLHLDLSQSGVFPAFNKNFDVDDVSDISDNLEYINNFIEENYQMVLTENIFITNPDLYHSIIPFFLISSKQIHRMTLSDYEIKLVYKSFKNKLKTNRIDGIDYYKIGLINFYKGKFLLAYSNFKMAHKLRKEVNIMKWLAFTILIIIFCHKIGNSNFYENSNLDEPSNLNNLNHFNEEKSKFYNTKIKFTSLKNILIYDDKEDTPEDESFIFGCCQNRKKKNFNGMSMNIPLNLKNELSPSHGINSQSITSDGFLGGLNNFSSNYLNKFQLCKELETLLEEAYILDREEKHFIELNWIYIIISVYCTLKPDQKVFKNEVTYTFPMENENKIIKFKVDPKYFVKKIKDKDLYLGYLAYAEFNYLIDQSFRIKNILSELITKFPTKIEAYLKFWNLLVKGEGDCKDKDYKLAHNLSEIFWKNSSTLNFDNNIYYLYITITHAKSLYYLGNNFYTITYFQKEYPANFLYPSIFFLFGKYSSKSNSKSLKSIALSSLYQVYKLLYKDLQYSCLYWIGNVYYNSGNYDLCYKYWKLYLEHSFTDEICDITEKKLSKIKNFQKKYELLGNSLLEFKKNLNYVKKDNIKFYSRVIKDEFEIHEQMKDFISDLTAIRDLQPNIRDNFYSNYEFYRGLVHFYVEKNYEFSMRIFVNIINSNKTYMDAYFALWRIIKHCKEYKVLLNFSYFMIKNSHSADVSYEEWIKSYILYAKALFLNERYDDSVELLRNMLDIFANIPLDNIKFLSEVHKSNKIFTTNNFVNFDYALSFYSKYHVYKKSEAIFHFNFKYKGNKGLDKENPYTYNINFSNKKKIVQSFVSHSANLKNENLGNLGSSYIPSKNLDTKQENNNYELDLSINNSISNLNLHTEKEFIHGQVNETLVLNTQEENYKEIKGDFLLSQVCNTTNNNYFSNGSVYNSMYGKNIEDVGVSSFQKLEEYIEKKIEFLEIPEEYTCKLNI